MTTTNTNDPVEIARQLIRDSLSPYFKGPKRAERMQNAANDIVEAIVHLIQTTPATQKGRLGATVMTETASTRNPQTGKHNVPPRVM
jgi:hypothetical protein